MKPRIVQIGNSQGLRIPKPLLAAAGLGPGDQVEITVVPDGLRIRRAAHPREGWAEAAAALAAQADDGLLDAPTSTRFDDEGWTW
jgi:antitoxin MazE